jgi:hypothetical protein
VRNHCWQRLPEHPFVRAENLRSELDTCSDWLWELTIQITDRHCPARASSMVGRVGSMLQDD